MTSVHLSRGELVVIRSVQSLSLIFFRIQIVIQEKRMSYLNSVFGQVGLEREHLPGIDIGIVRILEGFLELLKLVAGEDGPGRESYELVIDIVGTRERERESMQVISWH